MKSKRECEKMIRQLTRQLTALQDMHPVYRIENSSDERLIKGKINTILWFMDISNQDERYYSEVEVNG